MTAKVQTNEHPSSKLLGLEEFRIHLTFRSFSEGEKKKKKKDRARILIFALSSSSASASLLSLMISSSDDVPLGSLFHSMGHSTALRMSFCKRKAYQQRFNDSPKMVVRAQHILLFVWFLSFFLLFLLLSSVETRQVNSHLFLRV